MYTLIAMLKSTDLWAEHTNHNTTAVTAPSAATHPAAPTHRTEQGQHPVLRPAHRSGAAQRGNETRHKTAQSPGSTATQSRIAGLQETAIGLLGQTEPMAQDLQLTAAQARRRSAVTVILEAVAYKLKQGDYLGVFG